MQLAMSEINDTQWDIQQCVIFQYLVDNFPQLLGYQSFYYGSREILCVLNNLLLASHKICNWSPDDNLSAKMK